MSSSDNHVDIRNKKSWNSIEKVTITGKFDLSYKIKWDFF